MKKYLSTLFACFLLPFLSFSQEIEWQNTIGGSGADILRSITQTKDGGFILGGYSESNSSGDKTENSNGSYDYWIVKTDSLGNIQWQNTIGGSGDDELYSISPTSDGGYILGGRSSSDVSGDKTENSNGIHDYWIIKTDSLGLIQWQKWCEEADVYGTMQTADINYSEEQALFKGRKGVGLGAKQYRSVYIEPFGKINIHHLAFLDSELVDSRKYKGLPLPSYEYIIFNYGYGDGRDSNVFITTNPDVEQYGYSIGTWSPLGPVLGNPAIHNRFLNGLGNENAFKYIHECMFGLVVKDPSSMIWFRPAVKI